MKNLPKKIEMYQKKYWTFFILDILGLVILQYKQKKELDIFASTFPRSHNFDQHNGVMGFLLNVQVEVETLLFSTVLL